MLDRQFQSHKIHNPPCSMSKLYTNQFQSLGSKRTYIHGIAFHLMSISCIPQDFLSIACINWEKKLYLRNILYHNTHMRQLQSTKHNLKEYSTVNIDYFQVLPKGNTWSYKSRSQRDYSTDKSHSHFESISSIDCFLSSGKILLSTVCKLLKKRIKRSQAVLTDIVDRLQTQHLNSIQICNRSSVIYWHRKDTRVSQSKGCISYQLECLNNILFRNQGRLKMSYKVDSHPYLNIAGINLKEGLSSSHLGNAHKLRSCCKKSILSMPNDTANIYLSQGFLQLYRDSSHLGIQHTPQSRYIIDSLGLNLNIESIQRFPM